MKLVHLSDLHLGKRVNGYSMLEDQKYILTEILKVLDEEQPDGVLIAGDVYDQSVPSAEAVTLLDWFLVRLVDRELPVYLSSGNHDSAERLAFGGRLMERSGIHLAPVYKGLVTPIEAQDDFGPVRIWLLPFLKPALVRRWFPDEEIRTYTDAVAAAIRAMNVDTSVRNILVAHQFVAGAERCDSEEVSVGGLDSVDASVFAPFDYVALGHLHRPQFVGGGRCIRYCGTPLKYSFSEVQHKKSFTVVDLGPKGEEPSVRTIPLTPQRDWVQLRGTYEELTRRSFYEGTSWQEDYVRIILTNEDDVLDAQARLRTIYHNLMVLGYDNCRTRAEGVVEGAEQVERMSPVELLDQFYDLQNGQPMSDQQRSFAQTLIEEIWEGKA